MYTGPIIDSHMHLWDLANGYAWLSNCDPNMERLFGNYDSLRKDFLVPDYMRLTSGFNVVKSVHVQAFGFPNNPAGETQWLQEQADQYGYPHGIVAYADLADPGVEETLQQHCERANARGIRMPLNYAEDSWRRMCDRNDYMRDKQWRKGFALLSRYGLTFDLQMYDHQTPDAVALARDFPETTILIEHLAWPIDLSDGGFKRWSDHLASLAERPNVFLKVSGIGCIFGRSHAHLIPQYLRQAIVTFSPDRCLFGRNCPPDTVFYDFAPLLKLYMVAVSDYSPNQQHQFFCGTAQRVYRL
jgi:predicted TIM-barrel fold metal-dependent hydrolase